jgi:hypothetical protein
VTVESIFDRFNHLVSVAGLLSDEIEGQPAQIALLQRTAAMVIAMPPATPKTLAKTPAPTAHSVPFIAKHCHILFIETILVPMSVPMTGDMLAKPLPAPILATMPPPGYAGIDARAICIICHFVIPQVRAARANRLNCRRRDA